MPGQISIKKNMIMNVILTASSFIFPLVTFPYVSRILLADGTGKVAFTTSVIAYFAMFAQLGIPTYGIRACAIVRDNKQELTRIVHEILVINIITMFITYIAFFITLFVVPKFLGEKTLFIITASTMLFNTIGVEWLYKGLEQYTYITIRSIIFKFIGVITMFLFIHQPEDYIIYGAITVFAGIGSNILNFINLRRIVNLHRVGNYNFRRHLKPIFVFFSMAAAILIYTNLNTVLIGFIKTDTDVGYYSAAIKVKSILTACVTSLGAVLLPRASYYIKHKQTDEFIKISSKALNFVLVSSIPASVYFMLYSEECIYLLSGMGFHGAILPMQIMMPTVITIGLTNILGIQMMVPLGKERYVFYSVVAGAVINLILCLALIPCFSSIGAAIGTLAAEITVLIVQLLFVRDIVGKLFKKNRYWIQLTGTFLAIIASYWVHYMNLENFITLVMSAVIFFGVYFLTLLILKEPLVNQLYKQVIGKLYKNGAN